MSTKVVNAVREREAAKRLAAIVEVAQPKKAKKVKQPKVEKPVDVVIEPEPVVVEVEAGTAEAAAEAAPEPEGPEVVDAYDDRPAETVTEADAVDVTIENADDPVEETVTE